MQQGFSGEFFWRAIDCVRRLIRLVQRQCSDRRLSETDSQKFVDIRIKRKQPDYIMIGNVIKVARRSMLQELKEHQHHELCRNALSLMDQLFWVVI